MGTSVFWNQDRHFWSQWVNPRQNYLCIVDTGQAVKVEKSCVVFIPTFQEF